MAVTAAIKSSDIAAPSTQPRLVHVRHGPVRHDPAGARAAEQLRADEYIDRRGWVDASNRAVDGGETDEFDDVSSHYAVLRHCAAEGPVAIGTVRFVRPLDTRLPLFDPFPSLVERLCDSVEVSRYIARDPATGTALRAVILAELLNSAMTGVAIISTGLRALLTRQGFVLREITEPQIIDRYGRRPQVGVEIDAAVSALSGTHAALMPAALQGDWERVLSLAIEVER